MGDLQGFFLIHAMEALYYHEGAESSRTHLIDDGYMFSDISEHAEEKI